MRPPTQHTEQQEERHSCAWLLHGLNTKPEKMSALQEYLRKYTQSSSVGILAGHHPDRMPNEVISASQWKSEFSSQWNNAISDCTKPNDKRIFVGYSLGALVALSLLDGSFGIQSPTHMVLIAPALKLRKKVAIVKAISWLPFGALPSLNHRDYRARNWTSLSAYDALFDLNNAWKKDAWKISGTIPTLVFLAKYDELVDSQNLAEKVKDFPLWKTIWISNEASTLKPAYHHLMIDEASAGIDSWTRMKSHIDQLLNENLEKTELKYKSGE
jgi:alpha-beta hydrolase superfamily lysophospholipase